MRRRDTDERTERARQAVAVAFAVNGLTFASWISRAPAIRDALELTTGQLGAVLLCASLGSLVALPLSGLVIGRLGPSTTVAVTGVLVALSLTVAGLGVEAGTALIVCPALVAIGLTFSTWDVAMNVEGADVERRLGRTLMPRFHAAFSLGTVAGAGLGAACAATGVGVGAQLAGTAVASGGAAVTAARWFLPLIGRPDTGPPVRATTAWRERRTLLIGVAVLCFALGEGVANDWLALAVVDGYGRSDALGAVAFGAFVAAMTVGRTVGGTLLGRHGRPRVLRATAVTAVAGVAMVVLGPSPAWALAGGVVWGLGASLGFPAGMSAAADDERMATARVSVVSSIGYTAFLGGPPLVGVLADHFGILDALLVVVAAMALAVAVVGALGTPPATDGAVVGHPR